MIGRLGNGVFFCMRADTLPKIGAGWRISGTSRTASITAVDRSPRGTIITGGDHTAIFDNHRSNLATSAITPPGHLQRDIHKIGIPVRSFECRCFHGRQIASLTLKLQDTLTSEFHLEKPRLALHYGSPDNLWKFPGTFFSSAMSYHSDDKQSENSTLPDTATVDAILTRIKNGDDQAFDELVTLFHRPIFNLAYRMLNNNYEDANDAAQDIFIRVHKSLDKFRGDSKFSTWLYTLASNVCRNRIRKNVRIRSHESQSLDATYEDSDTARDTAVDPGTSAAEQSEAGDIRQTVETVIATLPEEFREVIVMRDLQHMSYDEIANATDTSMGTVKSRLSRARKLAKDKLQRVLT